MVPLIVIAQAVCNGRSEAMLVSLTPMPTTASVKTAPLGFAAYSVQCLLDSSEVKSDRPQSVPEMSLQEEEC